MNAFNSSGIFDSASSYGVLRVDNGIRINEEADAIGSFDKALDEQACFLFDFSTIAVSGDWRLSLVG
ncbi:hypothetical protein D3C78_1373790 [compost metagenome]